MSPMTQGKVVSDVVKWEPDSRYSRDRAIIAGDQVVLVGTPLQVHAGGYDLLEVATVESSIVAIALEAVTSGTDEEPEIVVLARAAIVAKEGIEYGAMAEDAVDAQLKTLGIIVREGPVYSNV